MFDFVAKNCSDILCLFVDLGPDINVSYVKFHSVDLDSKSDYLNF